MLGSGCPASDLSRLASSIHSSVGNFRKTFDKILLVTTAEVQALHLGRLAGKGVRKLVVHRGDSGAQRRWRKQMRTGREKRLMHPLLPLAPRDIVLQQESS